MSLRIYDVRVNGVPLDVGPNCRTSSPLDVQMKGTKPEYTVNDGGILRGTFKIPPFTGCGVGEDLDSLFTASISGPDTPPYNYIKLVQGRPCILTTHRNCTPDNMPVDIPKPQR